MKLIALSWPTAAEGSALSSSLHYPKYWFGVGDTLVSTRMWHSRATVSSGHQRVVALSLKSPATLCARGFRKPNRYAQELPQPRYTRKTLCRARHGCFPPQRIPICLSLHPRQSHAMIFQQLVNSLSLLRSTDGLQLRSLNSLRQRQAGLL